MTSIDVIAGGEIVGIRSGYTYTMTDEQRFLTMRQQAWRAAYDAFATGYLFEKRRRNLGKRLRLNNFVHLAVPLAVGASALTFGIGVANWAAVIWIAGGLGVVQVIVSLWALNERWEERLAHASESASANHDLSRRFRTLAENPPDLSEFARRLDVLMAENQQREQADYKQDLTDAEKREGHRATLRQFDKKCHACGEVPTSMKASKCDLCGNF